MLARHCSGGLILGFRQAISHAGVVKPGTRAEMSYKNPKYLPTPWNHLEAGILFGLGLPLLVFHEEGVDGGIFDAGVTDVYVHLMPKRASDGLDQIFLKWQADVRQHYYGH